MRGTRLELPEDYIQRAIDDTLRGRRTVKPGISTFQHLAGAISSLISLDAQSAENRHTVAWPMARGGDGEERAFDPPSCAETPEDSAAAREQAIWTRHQFERIRQTLSPEPMLAAFAEFVMSADKAPTPLEIAESLNCPVSEIYNMRKQLRRRLGPILAPGNARESDRG